MVVRKKTCLFCDTSIPHTLYVCRKHVQEYRQYKDEIWCKEFIKAQRKQSTIDFEECQSIDIFYDDLLSRLLKQYDIAKDQGAVLDKKNQQRIQKREEKNRQKDQRTLQRNNRRRMYQTVVESFYKDKKTCVNIAQEYGLTLSNVLQILYRYRKSNNKNT